MQNERKFDMPRAVARRRAYRPSGASLGMSSFTRRLVGCLPLLASVGMLTLAPGMFVQRATGSARLVPVSVNSRLVPRCTPEAETAVSVGAAGLGAGGGGWAGTAGTDTRTARIDSAVNRRQRVMTFLVGDNRRRRQEGGSAVG